MSTPISKRALSAGLGVGALALLAQTQRASADTPFTSFPFAAGGAPTARTMPDRLGEIKNVKDFGAVGNRIADDTAAIQAAINAALATSTPGGLTYGAVVYFPPGQYKITSPLLAPNPGYEASVTLRGAGFNASTIIGNFNDYIINKPDDGGVTIKAIEKLYIVNQMSGAGGGIRMDRANNCVIRQCQIQACNALHLGGADYNVMCISVMDCIITSNAASGTSGYIGIICGQVEFYNCTVVGWDIGLVHSNVGLVIHGSRFETNNTAILLGAKDGLASAISHSASIVANSFERNNTVLNALNCSAVVVEGNSFTGNLGVDGSTTVATGILMGTVTAAKVAANTFGMAVSNACIDLTGADASNVVFEGNYAGVNPGGTGVPWKMPNYLKAADFTFIGNNNPSAAIPFGGLPGQVGVHLSTPIEGMQFDITDSNTRTWGATAAGGGSNHVRVRYNGSNWTVIGA